MSTFRHITDFFGSLVQFALGKEPNLIPLSGLTLEKRHREMAKRALAAQVIEDHRDELHQALADFHGTSHAWTFGSGRGALFTLLNAFDVKPGDQILVCGYTCVAVHNSVFFTGAEPIYYDIELNTYGPRLDDIRNKASKTSKVKGIIVQHTYGLIGDETLQVIEYARSQGWWVIEDACHALGSRRNGALAGSWGDAAFFSSELSKCISTFKGGWAIVNAEKKAWAMHQLYRRVSDCEQEREERLLRQFITIYDSQRDNGRWYKRIPALRKGKKDYMPGNEAKELEHKRPVSFLHKLPLSFVPIALDQIQNIEEYLTIRREKAEEWAFWADHRGLRRPKLQDGHEPVMLRYPVLVEEDHKTNSKWARDLGVELGVWYMGSLHPKKEVLDNCPQAALAVQGCVNLPLNLAHK